jgi:hypothetical protein
VSGIKRHIVVDIRGLPHAVSVTAANVTDRQGAIEMIGLNKDNLSDVKKLTGIYGGAVRDGGKERAEVEAVKRACLRCFPGGGWKLRVAGQGEAAGCERKIHNSCQMVILALIAVLTKRF